MIRLIVFIACLAINIVAWQSPGPQAPNAHDSNVTYKGFYANEVEGFVGIRFAEDTGGENRFKPPVSYTPPPHSIQDATVPGPACPQRLDFHPPDPFNAYSYVQDISEDCLRLNVWRPNATQAGDKLPVLVYIYGGGFNTGNKDGILSQPGGMILQSIDNGHPIMNVEMNYRLGVFGFAQSDALLRSGAVNGGIRDQRLALEWVRDNIAAFGGDPERITIHGQSSGGLAVGMQVMAYGSTTQPFQQVIGESQFLEPGITGNYSRHATARVWLKTSCTGDAFDSDEAVECLRQVPMRDLLKYQLETHQGAGPKQDAGDTYLPVVDGDILPAAPSDLINEGRFAQNMTTMVGWTDNDAMLFTPLNIHTPKRTHFFICNYVSGLTDQNCNTLLSLYPSSEFHTTYFPNGTVKVHAEAYRTGRIYRDILFTCQAIWYAEAISTAGNAVYFYNQNASMLPPDLAQIGLAGLGVVHESELIYVFGNISKYNIPGWPFNPTVEDYRLQTQQSRSWSSFTATGQPVLEGHDTLQDWKPAEFDDQNFGVRVIGGPYDGYAGSGGDEAAIEIMAGERLQERCGFLNSPEIIKELRY